MYSAHLNVTPDTLNSLVEFDCPFKVLGNGTIESANDYYAPEVYDDSVESPWSLLSGYTGQYGYNGPTMHPSEYLGGRMAVDILGRPGIYVIVEMRDEDGSYPDGDPIGWAVAYREN